MNRTSLKTLLTLFQTSEVLKTMFLWFVFLSLCFCCLQGDEVKSVSVMEGHSVTLHINTADTHTDDLILWSFGTQETHIARVNREANKVSVYADVHDGMFRDRLQVDNQTGSLTITNITTQHSGLYHMIIHGQQETSYTFNMTVYARLPLPHITSYCPQNSSSSSVSTCVLLCSVMNVTHVSLSWYKGKSLLSSISVSDLNIRLSLPLEVEYQDTNTYRCVINNPITNHTQHLNITQVCHKCSDCGCCCNGPEPVIRLAISAVVGVATVAVLLYDVRCRKVQTSPSDHR
ncbi:uncharacterized protein LOC130548467 [Triplophysa rosa]|uniref:uncharacterized protein LOC130548467 n=1 Tax=Triplophysa rosa TaxID=992332 RepID=UPI0025461DC0|nr:uncharacterized protein LOC130548467 [Triplophysa rosa]